MNPKTKMIAGTIASMLVVLTAPWAASSEPETPYAILDTTQGIITLSQDEFHRLQQDDTVECGGTAPLATYCLNVEEGVREASFFGHGCITQGPYYGSMESRIVHEGDDRVFVCNHQGGFPILETYGEWPAIGDTYRHEGYSYMEGTYEHEHPLAHLFALISEGEPHGVPGGEGDWSVALFR